MEAALIIAAIALTIAFIFYRIDPKGWQNTFKHLATIIRANLNASKPVKQLEKTAEKSIEQKAKDDWTAEFTGSNPSIEKHEIVHTYYARVGGTLYPHYKCKCGYDEFELSIDTARRTAAKHVKEQNEAERLIELSNGGRAWEL